MKIKVITSYILASLIAIVGTTSNSVDITNETVNISSTYINEMPITVPNFPTNKNARGNTSWQNGQDGAIVQSPREIGNIPQKNQMLGNNFQQNYNNTQSSVITGYNDPGISMQYAISETNADLAWAKVDQKETVTIAVIDTGVDYTHDDLKYRVSTQYGYDFVNDDNDPMDDNGHGTHVAGIIGAEADNGIGIVGMVGDLDIEIIPIKALDAEGSGDVETVVKAIDYAINLDVDIINLSFGTEIKSKELDDIVAKAIENNIFVVVASGNSATLSDFSSPLSVEGVCAVGATNEYSMIASFSNFGENTDIGAPGEEIVSTFLNNEYSSQSGTSMATPIVASAAAILLAQDPTLTVSEINEILENNTSEVVRDRLISELSFGIVNIFDSLKSIS